MDRHDRLRCVPIDQRPFPPIVDQSEAVRSGATSMECMEEQPHDPHWRSNHQSEWRDGEQSYQYSCLHAKPGKPCSAVWHVRFKKIKNQGGRRGKGSSVRMKAPPVLARPSRGRFPAMNMALKPGWTSMRWSQGIGFARNSVEPDSPQGKQLCT